MVAFFLDKKTPPVESANMAVYCLESSGGKILFRVF